MSNYRTTITLHAGQMSINKKTRLEAGLAKVDGGES